MPNHDDKDLTEKQRYWLTHLEACEKSGQNVTSYAAANGLDRRVLYNWRSRLCRMGVLANSLTSGARRSRRGDSPEAPSGAGAKKSELGFRAVRVFSHDEPISGLRIRFPNGITLEASDSFEMSTSHELLSVLAALR